jgi:cytochrome c-type biogenesis protein CcmE
MEYDARFRHLFFITPFHHSFFITFCGMTLRSVTVALSVACAVVLAGCDYLPFGYTPVKDITAAPANFEGKEVKLKGKVRDVIKLPIVDLKAYTLQDESGEITVTTHGALPSANAEVALKGIVKSAVIIGGHSLGLRVEETKRLR